MEKIEAVVDHETLNENFKKAVAQMLVLHLICEKDRHIAEIIEEIRLRTSETFCLVTPYCLMCKLRDTGKIAESEKRIAPDGRLRQYYRITPKGRRSLDQQKQVYADCCTGVASIFLTKTEQED